MDLVVNAAGERAVPSEDAEGPVQVWREQDQICAVGYAAGDANWLALPRVATYRFTKPDEPIVAFRDEAVSHQSVVDGFERTVLPLALQYFGSESLHASGVLTTNGVIALCGDSGVGKSTLAHVLAARGHELWADDAVAFECRPHGVVALPLPFRPILLPAAEAAFGRPGAGGTAERTEQPLACVVILGRGEPGAPPVTVTRYGGAEALEAAISSAYCYRPDDLERNRRMMGTYLDLVARVRVVGVTFADDLDGVPAVADSIESLVQ